ncbi:tetratricopeptide repeat protein [Qipengyuania sphaerica]|uniref:tetratricopeptide repeat protein n=1 Tax=Qipengyuania sphaerica TaxID=2867243 RepID=UPI001C87FE3F|nr:tetratricopeptide repeat protein [Qipengyuania sphaerica]MBX7540519.1 tetratricopeptide repeat protein [Qipengyuania sphaerica]
MRFAPAAAALSLALAMTASITVGQTRDPDPRAGVLIAQGQSALRAGDTQGAIDAFESALAVDPGYTPTLVYLAEAARADDLQGKAISYYREALARDPHNIAAIAGEGEALAEKGALAKARLNLAKVQSMCGDSCSETRELAAAIAQGPRAPVLTAEANIQPQPQTN